MFRLQDNVPEVYVQESRDFQLFCNLYDSIFGGVKFDIDSLQYISNTKQCNGKTLELLKTKLGLFDDLELSDNDLRLVLQAFPTIIRYKGSKRALKYILYLFQRILHNTTETPIIEVVNSTEGTTSTKEPYSINITFANQDLDDKLLLTLLKYVLPTGYAVNYNITSNAISESTIKFQDEVIIKPSDIDDNIILNTAPAINDSDTDVDELTAAIGIAEISNPNN